jgi:AcrR family transcriptional regulator
MLDPEPKPPRRNRAFAETHERLIEVAVALISEKGVEALSLVELAARAGVNRTTVYYHFKDREALVADVRNWSAKQLAKAFAPIGSEFERAAYIARVVLDNPDLMRLWIEDFVAPGDIRERYPEWDQLVDGVARRLAAERPDEAIDAEIYCVNMLAMAMIGPRVFHASVRPDLDRSEVIRRTSREMLRMLRHDGIGDEDP